VLTPLRTLNAVRFVNNWLPRKLRLFLNDWLRVGMWDNSFRDEGDDQYVDAVCFAGTPDWMGRHIKPLYNMILNRKIPAFFLGIGGRARFELDLIPSIYREVIKNASLVVCRDSVTHTSLKSTGALLLPCPALFSSDRCKEIQTTQVIGLIWGRCTGTPFHEIPKWASEALCVCFNEFSRKYKVLVICHYIDELEEVRLKLPMAEVRYSYDSSDYISFYEECDLVVGARVHGIGLAASLAVPGVHLATDERADTVRSFLANSMVEADGVSGLLAEINDVISSSAEKSKELAIHKQKTMEIYCNLLRERCCSFLK
jgi:hypothetical protein